MKVVNYNLLHPKISEAIVMFMIVLLGLIVRLNQLDGQSLWLDEIVDYFTSKQDFLSMLAGVREHPGGLPLHYCLEFIVIRLIGTNEFSLRLIPAVLSTISVWASYILAREIFPSRKTVGYLTAILMALSIFQIRYAQEARFYSLFVLLALLQWIAFYRVLRLRTNVNWVVYVGVTILAVYTHYFTFLILGCHCVYFIGLYMAERFYYKNNVVELWIDARKMVLSTIIITLVFLPCLLVYSSKESLHNSFQFTWSLLPSILRLLTGGISAWIALVLIFIGIIEDRNEKQRAIWLIITIIGLISGVISIDAWRRYYLHVRQLIFIQPLIFIIISAAIVQMLLWINKVTIKISQPELIITIGAMVFIISLQFPLLIEFKNNNQVYTNKYVIENVKAQWREATRYVTNNMQQNGIIIVMDSIGKRAVEYYLSQFGILNIPVIDTSRDMNVFSKIADQSSYYDSWLIRGDVGDYYWDLKPEERQWINSRFAVDKEWYLASVQREMAQNKKLNTGDINIHFNDTLSRLFTKDGFWEVRLEDGRKAAWSQGRASALIIPIVDKKPRKIQMTVKPIVPLEIKIIANGREVGSHMLNEVEWQDIQMDISSDVWRPGNNRLDIIYSKCRRYSRLARTRAVCWEDCKIIF